MAKILSLLCDIFFKYTIPVGQKSENEKSNENRSSIYMYTIPKWLLLKCGFTDVKTKAIVFI